MSIAEKLTTIAENVSKVFQAGYDKGKAEGGGNVPNLFEYATKIRDTFSSAVFPDGHELVINAPSVTNLEGAFANAIGIKKITLKGNSARNTVDFYNTFRNITTLEEVDLTEFTIKPTRCVYAFYNNSLLKAIYGEWDMSNATNVQNMFTNCLALEEIRFKPLSIYLSLSFANSKYLSAETVQSIVDGLATVETTQTLTLNTAIVVADTQKNTINNKGWTLVQK
jgi:hypothetical protein